MSITEKEALSRPYSVEIHYIPEDDGDGYFFAFHPEFGYSACGATGATMTDALSQLATVSTAVIHHYLASGRELPEVSPSPMDKIEGRVP